MERSTKALAAALVIAQKAIQGVGKHSKNNFHKYDYTSAEDMIAACREALHSAGLTARRVGWTISSTAEDGTSCMVEMRMVLEHGESGESCESVVVWPAVAEKGRPLDKAVAGALTTALNYWLRDLLLIPRGDEYEMDKRDDTNHEPARKPATGVSNRERLAAELSAWADVAPEDLADAVRAVARASGITINGKATESQAGAMLAFVREHKHIKFSEAVAVPAGGGA